ncbi:MAG: heparin lyase I family protein [Deltaproteobacteria bacterium]|nr:heparin lyase I family protein [Deltaproteobacteria bacterium]
MKKSFLLCLTLVSFSFLVPALSDAAVSLPWSTTFNCSDWSQSSGTLSNCDGVVNYGAWTCSNGDGTRKEEQITSLANNPGGAGGKGQRHWKGDGSNNNSGGLSVSLTSAQKELWIRWYMRYEKGFKWSPLTYDKILYIHTSSSGTDAIPEWYGSDSFNIYAQGGTGHVRCSTCGWSTTMGGTVSDGLWHSYEVHIKMDTNGSNGVAEAWVDDTKVLTNSAVNFGTKSGWQSFLIGSNQYSPSNGKCMATDFDDIAVSNTGKIGPVGGSTTLVPSPPTGAAAQ